MLNLQNIWYVLVLIISWKIAGVPDKPGYSLRDSPLRFYTLGHNLKDNLLIFQLTHEDHAIC
jgi:hypothetical protein